MIAPFKCPVCGHLFPRMRSLEYSWKLDTFARTGRVSSYLGHANRMKHVSLCQRAGVLELYGSTEPLDSWSGTR